MQRVSFRNSRGLRLVGNFFPSDSTAVVIMAHGFTSDKSSRGRFDRIAQSLNEFGYNALAFDFSGCGESDNDSLTTAKQVDDLTAAIAYVKSRNFSPIALLGHSLGSLICLRAYSPEVATMILTGALTGAMHYKWDEYYSPEQLRELAEMGFLTIPQNVGHRQEVIVESQMLKDFAEIDQPKLLSRVECPVLIIHGDNDSEERQLLERSRQGLHYLPKESRLEVIPGANHSFLNHMDRVVDLILAWLTEYLPHSLTGGSDCVSDHR
jgi:pimeloyl-ACP methyl ester carboxylesterase